MNTNLFRTAAFIARRAFIRTRSGFIARSAFILGGGLLLLPLAGMAQAPNLQVCANKGFMLTSKADAVSISGGVTYTWYVSKDNGAPASITNSNAAFISIPEGRPAGTYAYVRVAAGDACPKGIPANTFTVVVHAVPDNLSLLPATVCADAAATLTASATGAASYSLNGSTWTTASAFAVNQTAATSYTLYVKSAEGCVAGISTAVAVDTTPADLDGVPNACGCKSGLVNKSNVCKAIDDADTWADCGGFSAISKMGSEGLMTWTNGNTHCKSKGTNWDLPDFADMQCLYNFDPRPDAFFRDNVRWWTRFVSKSSDTYGLHRIVYHSGGLQYNHRGDDSETNNILCVLKN